MILTKQEEAALQQIQGCFAVLRMQGEKFPGYYTSAALAVRSLPETSEIREPLGRVLDELYELGEIVASVFVQRLDREDI